MDCSDVINIANIFDSLKILNAQKINTQTYYFGQLICPSYELNKGLSEDSIRTYESILEKKFPNQFREFLSLTNGLIINKQSKIMNISEIFTTRGIFSFYPQNILIIGYCYSSEVQICINLETKNNEYIYIIDSIADDYFYSLQIDFANFLNRFIVSQGSDFWNWKATKSDIRKIE